MTSPGDAARAVEMRLAGADPQAIASATGFASADEAMEAVKHLTGAGETLKNRLFLYDALYTEARSFEITRRADCPVCGRGQ